MKNIFAVRSLFFTSLVTLFFTLICQGKPLIFFNNTGEPLHMRLKQSATQSAFEHILTRNITTLPENKEIFVFENNSTLALDISKLKEIRLRLWPISYKPGPDEDVNKLNEYNSWYWQKADNIKALMPAQSFERDPTQRQIILKKINNHEFENFKKQFYGVPCGILTIFNNTGQDQRLKIRVGNQFPGGSPIDLEPGVIIEKAGTVFLPNHKSIKLDVAGFWELKISINEFIKHWKLLSEVNELLPTISLEKDDTTHELFFKKISFRKLTELSRSKKSSP